jgi:xanthine dehydrogenase accessory factor
MKDMVICIKGGGEMASAVAWRLHKANLRRIFMLECSEPLAVRRKVSFCEAVYDGSQKVEDIEAMLCHDVDEIDRCWRDGRIAIAVDPAWCLLGKIKTDVVIDAILAKKNLGTTLSEAPLVIGLGPGFIAGQDVHMVVETIRGHNLGRIITSGTAAPNTGIPGTIWGYNEERVLRAPADGRFHITKKIGERVSKGDRIGEVESVPVSASIDGMLRGLIRPEISVTIGLKIGDVDPRNVVSYCDTISEKARALGGAILETILAHYNS